MYKCEPYNDYKVSCTWVKLLFIDEVKTSIFARSDDNCGLNEYCALFVGECRTSLPDGSICLLDKVADHIITNIMVNTMISSMITSNATSLSPSLLCLLSSHQPPTMFHNLESSLKLLSLYDVIFFGTVIWPMLCRSVWTTAVVAGCVLSAPRTLTVTGRATAPTNTCRL